MKMKRFLGSPLVRLLAVAACMVAMTTPEVGAAKKNNRRRPSVTTKTTKIKHTGVVHRLGDPANYDPPPAAPSTPSWEQATFSEKSVRNIMNRVEDEKAGHPTNSFGRATTRDGGSMLFDPVPAAPGGGGQPRKQAGGQGSKGGR